MLSALVRSIGGRMLAGEAIPEPEKQRILGIVIARLGAPGPAPHGGRAARRKDALLLRPSQAERVAGLTLLTGERPQTKLLSDNAYELEALRLLALFGRGIDTVEDALDRTEHRLAGACFGRFCATGECPGASLAALRFHTAIRPHDTERQREVLARLRPYRDGSGGWSGIKLPWHYTLAALLACNATVAQEDLEYCAPMVRRKLLAGRAGPAQSLRTTLYTRVLEQAGYAG